MSVALLADMMTGAIASTLPLRVLIVTFCQLKFQCPFRNWINLLRIRLSFPFSLLSCNEG
jgi:hypothetical protein